jgi:hypothetical protein
LVARLSGCIQLKEWPALNIADWSFSTKPLRVHGRSAERP